MRSRVLVLGILTVAALLVLAGCEALDELGEGVTTPGAKVTPAETVTPGAAVPEGAPEELALADLEDLEQFDSYRTSTVISWTSEADGPTLIEALVEATIEAGLAGVGREATQHTVITLTQGEQQTQTLEFVSRGDETWNRTDGQWVQVSVAPTDLLGQVGWVGNPSVVLSEDARGEFVATETMDGMELWHYHYPSEEIAEGQPFADFEDAQLDVWVSAEHHVAWRMALAATDTGPQGGAGELESVSMVDAVDEPVDIEVPRELEGGATPGPGATPTKETLPETGAEAPSVLARNAIPLIEGAMDVRAIGNVVVMNVDRAPAEVITYYTEQLERRDWTIVEPESESAARLTQDGRVVDIAAAPGQQEGQSTVLIAVREE